VRTDRKQTAKVEEGITMEGIPRGREGTVVHTRSDAVERQAARARVMLPRLEESQARIALGLFRMLAEGQPVSHQQLAERLTVPEGEVPATLAALPAVFYNDEGRIVAFWGLGLGESRHRVEGDGRTVYAWCFPDTLFYPRILGKSAGIESASPTGERISLVVRPDGIESVAPEGAVLTFVRLEGKQFDDNVISTFCHYNFYFPSEEEARRWAEEQPRDFLILTIEEGFELMTRIAGALYGDALGAGGDPTPRVGLTSETR
jgi:alkylmercury lyase